MTTYLGVDVGTTATKAALFDERGRTLRTARLPTRLERHGELRVEQDVEEVMRSVAGVVRQASGGAEPPALVAITAQGDGCWLVDERGRAVRPAISWLDGRAGDVLRDWEREGISDALYRATGNRPFPGSQACVLAWLDRHEPRALDAASTAAFCKDVVMQRLTGVRASDLADGSVPHRAPDGAAYAAEALRLCGLGDREGLLPPLISPLPSGWLTEEGAATAGLAAGTEVTSGPFDIVACASGAGLHRLGDGLLTVGTTLACQVLVDRVDASGEPAGWHLATGRPGAWLRTMPATVGSATLDWTLSMTGLGHASLEATLEASRPGAGGVEMLPYLAPSGERAPFVDPRATGEFAGLRLSTTREDLVRATCEGVAYVARDCLEAAGLTGRLLACGGGTRSRAWMRIFASVLDRPISLARSPEVGARGAVLRAVEASGRSLDRAAWAPQVDVVEPDPALVERYAEGYERHRERVVSARGLWTGAGAGRAGDPRAAERRPASVRTPLT